MKLPIALQLHTIREEVAKDFEGSMEKVAEIGYMGVEPVFTNIPDASRVKTILDRLGLKAVGCHVSFNLLSEQLDKVIDDNLEIGSPYIICPWDKHETLDQWMEAIRFYNQIGEKCKTKGLQFGYHNHAHEFKEYDGNYVLDLLYRNTDPAFVQAEIDTYWVYYAGVDPAAYIRKYAGRCPLVHLKDMESKESRDLTEVGSGIIDIRSIIDAAQASGTKWLIVEQDQCKRPPMESIRISFENLKKLNG